MPKAWPPREVQAYIEEAAEEEDSLPGEGQTVGRDHGRPSCWRRSCRMEQREAGGSSVEWVWQQLGRHCPFR